MSRQSVRGAQQQRGLTLIELMVSLVLGLLLVLGVVSVYLTNQQAARTNEGLARMQEGGRIAFELISRELRQAGGNACGARLVANVINGGASTWYTNFDAGPVRGVEGDVAVPDIVATGTAAGERVAGTDGVIVLSANATDAATVVSHDPPAASFLLNTENHGISTGEIVMVCDQQSAAITQITTAQPGINKTIVHNTGTGTPGNCTKGLGYPTLCTTNGTPKTFTGGSIVSRLNPGFWYIGNNPRGGRSLYRFSPPATREEITDGVSDLQLRYLTRRVLDGALDTDWLDASEVQGWNDSATHYPVAVRLQLSLESLQRVGTDQQPLRREQVYAVTLRNRVP